jgi:hypothetical protein
MSGRVILRNHRNGLLCTERHRSRTCLASGYDAVLVLKSNESRSLSHFSAFFRELRSRSLRLGDPRLAKTWQRSGVGSRDVERHEYEEARSLGDARWHV